ncbi:hypothetical protein ACJ41O_004968 [Fusarium nematophilum]
MTDAQIAGGHKATINNPNTSQEAKEHSRQVLENEFNGGNVPKAEDNKDKNPGNVAGGLKALVEPIAQSVCIVADPVVVR